MSRTLRRMAAKSLAERVAALEAQVDSKSIDSQFREQAELIDRRFTDEFRQQAELIDRLFAQRFRELDKKWFPRFATVEQAVGSLQQAVGSLQKDVAIVREGISILLQKRLR